MQDNNPNEFKPGQAISPQPAHQPAANNAYAQSHVDGPQAAPTPAQAHSPVSAPSAPQAPADEPEDSGQDAAEGYEDDASGEATLLTWNAPEFTFVNKPGGWFAILALFFVIMIAIAVWTKQWLSIGLFALMGVALGIYANRKPRTLNYTITTHGVYVGDKAYPFDSFSAFYEVSDYGQRVFELVPAKRFGTLISLPVSEDHEDSLESLIGTVLPKTPARNDVIDRFFRYLRF